MNFYAFIDPEVSFNSLNIPRWSNIIFPKHKFDHVSSFLKSLEWLSIVFRINSKFFNMAAGALYDHPCLSFQTHFFNLYDLIQPWKQELVHYAVLHIFLICLFETLCLTNCFFNAHNSTLVHTPIPFRKALLNPSCG